MRLATLALITVISCSASDSLTDPSVTPQQAECLKQCEGCCDEAGFCLVDPVYDLCSRQPCSACRTTLQTCSTPSTCTEASITLRYDYTTVQVTECGRQVDKEPGPCV